MLRKPEHVRQFKKQSSESDEVPIYSSGYLMEEPHTLEVTLTGSPAVTNATFRVTRNIAEGKSASKDDKIVSTIPINRKIAAKQQVFGYVSVPWLEDSYGDILDPKSIEQAAHSFMRNLVTRQVEGETGIGEEHMMFYKKAFPIQSVIDYTGEIGGIPGGWWLGTQITDPEVWEKITSNQYIGYSLGSLVFFTHTGSSEFREGLFNRIPNLSSVESKPPAKGKLGAMKQLGLFGYPDSKTAYADPVNLKYPIDTLARAFATMQYVLESYPAEGYDEGELKYVLRRMVGSIVRFEVDIPDTVRNSLGLKTKKSLVDNVLGVIKGFAPPTEPTEEVDEMDRDEIMEVVQSTVDAAVKEQLKGQAEAITEEVQKNVTSVLDEFTAKMQTNFDALASSIQSTSAEGSEELIEEGEEKNAEKANMAAEVAAAVVAALQAQEKEPEAPESGGEEGEEENLNEKLQNISQQLSELSKATSGRLSARKTIDETTLTDAQKAELAKRKEETPFDVEPTFMTGMGDSAFD